LTVTGVQTCALPIYLGAHEFLLLPGALPHALRRLGDLARQREHQADRQLRGRRGVALRGVDDEDALVGRRLDVDVVDADASAARSEERRVGNEGSSR